MGERSKKKLDKKSILMLVIAVLVLLVGVAVMYMIDHRSTGEGGGESRKLYNIGGYDCYKKQNIETYLFLGVDSTKDADTTKKDKDHSIQCDSVNLLIIDRVDDTYTTLNLNRDAMVPIEVTDEDGNVEGENTMQLALAYAYGDGKEQSCKLAKDAVSKLLYDQRIDGCVALSMDAIGLVNNLVGGVDVTIEDDFHDGSGLVKGQTVHLSDKQAEAFVRGRMSVGDGTNEGRVRRQQAYLDALFPAMLSKLESDKSFVNDALKKLEPYMVTDMSNGAFSRIANVMAKGEKLDPIEIKSTRTVSKSTGYAEVFYDEESLDDAVVQLFYTIADEEE